MRAGLTRSFFRLAATAAMAATTGSAMAASVDADRGAAPPSAPGVIMIAVLVVCFVALVQLVATLPAVKNWFRRVLHIGSGLPPHTVTLD